MPAFPTFFGVSSGSIINAKQYGAVGDGVALDHTAINSAITELSTAGGGTLYLPRGTYKITSAIVPKNNVRLCGAASMGYIGAGGPAFSGTIIDARNINTGDISQAFDLSAGNLNNIVVENLLIRGPAAASCAATDNPGSQQTGIYANNVVSNLLLWNLYIEGFTDAISINGAVNVTISNVSGQNSKSRALAIVGSGTQNVKIFGSGFGNSGLSNRTLNGNVFIGNSGTPGNDPSDIRFYGSHIDEAGYASVQIQSGTDISFHDCRVYSAGINANGTGPGYGILFGDGTYTPSRVNIFGGRVGPFGAHTSTNTLLIRGSGHSIRGLTTYTNGGGGVSDSSTGSYIDIDGSIAGATLSAPALGTPASGTLSNCTGLPIGTGVSGLGSGVATFLGTPSSANLASAVTDETGSGALVFGTSPAFTTQITTPKIITASGDLLLAPASHTTEQRSGTNAQFKHLYNTFTDTSNYERLGLRWVGNQCYVVVQKAGSGTGRDLILQSDGGNVSIAAPSGTLVTLQAGDSGKVQVKGSGLSLGTIRGKIFDHYSDTATTHTDGTEDTLYSDTTAANTLPLDGSMIEAEHTINIVGHATATRQIRAYFAGTKVLESTAAAFASNTTVRIRVVVIRESGTVVRVVAEFTQGIAQAPTYTRITSLNLGTTNILKSAAIAAGTGAASGDITAVLGKVEAAVAA